MHTYVLSSVCACVCCLGLQSAELRDLVSVVELECEDGLEDGREGATFCLPAAALALGVPYPALPG